MLVWAVIVAAGSGSRFGMPKQFAALGGRAVVHHSIAAARAVCDGVVVVLPAGHDWTGPEVDTIVTGGATRSASVRAGLAVIPADAGIVVVHDAARPLASPALFRAVVDAVVAGVDGAVPGLAVTDTVKRVAGDVVTETVERAPLRAVQTPQAFRAEILRTAHAGEPDATDDAALVEAAGGRVVVIPGETRNLKITTTDDLIVAGAFVRLI
jgi:2-C-methyl-D-erythritol 4-phosphate cytidylyltransferase